MDDAASCFRRAPMDDDAVCVGIATMDSVGVTAMDGIGTAAMDDQVGGAAMDGRGRRVCSMRD
jgi:hypothetical protein